jgi:hypothetical protein
MTEESHFAKAHQAIGEYFCAFSGLERELGETIKVVFRLQQHEASDTIVAALGDMARKINLVWAATQKAKNVDGTETSDAWKKSANETMKSIFSFNDDRNALAHSYLEPNADGSVHVARLQVSRGALRGTEPNTWTYDAFVSKVRQLKSLTNSLRTVREDLSTYTITIPDLGFITIDPYQPMPRKWPPSDLAAQVTEPISPNPAAPEAGKADC